MSTSAGTAGAVEFPGFIEDQHGLILQNSTTSDGEFDNSSLTQTNTTLAEGINDAQNNNAFENVTKPSNWSQKLSLVQDRINDFSDEIDDFKTANSSVVVSDAVDAYKELQNQIALEDPEYRFLLECPALGDFNIGSEVGGPSSISDVTLVSESDLQTNIPGVALTILEDLFNKVENLKSEDPQTLWDNAVASVKDELDNQGLQEEVDVDAIVSAALTDAENLLNDAIAVAKNVANSQEVADVVAEFEARREDDRQRQVARFNAQMVDANAVNSSAFMIGQALIGREQQREAAEFDAQTTLETFQNAIQTHVESYAQNLQGRLQGEGQNAETYNQILQDAVELILQVDLQDGKLTQESMAQVYGNVLGQQLQSRTALDENTIQARRDLEQLKLQAEQNTLSRDELKLQLDDLRLRKAVARSEGKFEASVARREAQDREYLRMMEATYNIFGQRRQLFSNLTELQRVKAEGEISAEQSYKSWEQNFEQQKELWDLLVLEQGANILSAPSGMARRLPEGESTFDRTRKLVGTGVQAAGAAASIAAAASDWRLKKNIEKIGHLPSGLPLYEFEYLWGQGAIGVLAQEARELFPEAVLEVNDFLAVRYNMLR